MKLYDRNAEQELSLLRLRSDWKEFRAEDPLNHSADFTTELYEILMSTVNGRNDCEVIGMTPQELSCFIIKLRDKINRR